MRPLRTKTTTPRGPAHIERYVESLLSKTLGPTELELARLRARWPDIVTARIATKTAPATLQKTTLIVHVCDAQWLHELSYLRQDLLARIAPHVRSVALRAVALRLGAVHDPVMDNQVATEGVAWHGQPGSMGMGGASSRPEAPFLSEATTPESAAALSEILASLRVDNPELYESAAPIARPVDRRL